MDMEQQKPQETVRRETKRIATGQVVFLAVMLIVYAVIGQFSMAVLLGGVIGSIAAVMNFFMLGRTVQRVVEMQVENADLARAQMKSSYSMRMAMLVLMAIVAFALPFVDGLATVIPLTFPRATILVLQLTGKMKDI